jgi:hypothetical protein
MAEFKLGRLRFVWKNEWIAGTVYYKDDVVSFNGKVYICVIGHTSAEDFNIDLTAIPAKWNIVADGQTWLGNWQPQQEYQVENIVKYGARLYIAKEGHISAEDSSTGLEADLDKWEIYAEGLEWKGDWQTSFDYKINDFVKYGGSTYVVNTPHISAPTEELGLEEDIGKWTPFNQGFDFKGDWDYPIRYKLNDVVKFGASLWIADTPHTSQEDFGEDSEKWTKFVEGFQYEAEWSPFKNYQPGDVVNYGGNQFIALIDNSNAVPSTSTENWSLFSEGLRFRGDWNEDSSLTGYQVGDVVRLGGYNYRAIKDSENQQPPNAEFWERLNTGLNWRGAWLDDQEYFEGDVVRFGDNSYVAVQNHISEGDDFSSESSGAASSRPDLDDGTYWNIIAVGTEQSVLTEVGDLVYFSTGGPQRLPIGENGQILSVSAEGIPEWAFIGDSADVYYVAEFGKDEPAPIYGKNIDRPWKSIRYAAQQVEQGTKEPKAAELLRLNRRFIQREIVEWTEYQIDNGIAPFTSSFDYDTVKCERDMGFLVDAFIWDLQHGGNVRSREAALAYVNAPENSDYQNQKQETVASINYGLTLIQNVLAQTEPEELYQVLNGDNSTRVVEQYFIPEYGRQDNVDYDSTIKGSTTGGIASGSSTGSSGFTGGGIGGY